jgi:serine/threonine protein kinase
VRLADVEEEGEEQAKEKVEKKAEEQEEEKVEEKKEKTKEKYNFRWKLIDLDAAAKFSQDELGYAGSKSSSAYCAPEMMFKSKNGVRVKTYPPEQSKEPEESKEQQKPLYNAQPASPSLDAWSFGAVLYLMVIPLLQETWFLFLWCLISCVLSRQCTGSSLFKGTNNDTLGQSELRKLASWSDRDLRERVAVIRHRFARHLVSRLLQRDPKNRITVAEALKHQFFQPADQQAIGRLPGEEPRSDVFLS